MFVAANYTGQRFGPFLLEKEIATHGGMSVVYMGKIVSSDYPAESRNLRTAIKVVREHQQYGDEFQTMLVRETGLLSKLHHPGIVRIFPIMVGGKSEWWRRQTITPSGDCPYYFAMEYLPKNLSDISIISFPLGWRVELITQIAQAIYFLHALDVAHRDLKPENIMLRAEPSSKNAPQPVLIDFGLSEKRALRARTQDDRALTVHWAPPERINAALNTKTYTPTMSGGAIKYDDFAADVWSFGMLAYWILTGRYAFGNMSQERTALVDGITRRVPENMSTEIPIRLRDLVMWMLSKDPNSGKRPNILEVLTALQRDIELLPPRF